MKHLLCDVLREISNKVVIQVLTKKLICCRMNSIGSLMESIFSVDIVKYLSNAYAISRGDNCFFIVLVFVLGKRLLRANKEWITTAFNCVVGVA